MEKASKKSTVSNAVKKKLSAEEFLKVLKPRALETNEQGEGLISAFRRSGIGNPIILAGTQQIRVKRTIEWIKQNFFSGSNATTKSYFADELGSQAALSKLMAALTNLSLFTSTELVVIYDVDRIKAASAKTLAEAVLRGRSTTLIVLTAASTTQKSALLNAIERESTVIEFKDLEGETLRRWIVKEIAQNGGPSGIEDKALEMLIKSYGSDLSALSREIAKLSLLTAIGEKITKELVQSTSLKSPEANNFSLVTALARQDALGAVSLAQSLVDQGLHPLQISAFLNRCFRTLLGQVNPTQLANAELSNNWFIRSLNEAKSRFSFDELQKSVELIKKLDFQLKDSVLPDSLTLPLAMQKIACREF